MTDRKADIFLVAVNKHEDEQLREELKLHGHESKDFQGASMYHYDDFGLINGHRVMYGKSEMASSWTGAAGDTVRKAISDINPRLVVCVGIAWGAKETEQQIGDVLIAQEVQIGANAKIGPSSNKFRSPSEGVSQEAAATFKRSAQKSGIRFHAGKIISKEDLFDNKTQRNRAVKAATGCIGGEMEAAGALKALIDARAENDRHYELAVVKAICDWGYKKNVSPEQKEKDQAHAAKCAAKVVVNAIRNWKLVKEMAADSTETVQAVTGPRTDGDSAVNLKKLLKFKDGLDYQFQWLSELKGEAVAFWPVRLRAPNIIHAAQAYTAILLEKNGIHVRLCLDDLGNLDPNKRERNIRAFKESIEKWAANVGHPDEGKRISSGAILFSEHFPDPYTDTNPAVYSELGRHLVKWLLWRDDIKEIFMDAKLWDVPKQSFRPKKPRRLLTPAVVWTVMERIFGNSPASSPNVITIGGIDEQDLWKAYQVQERLRIQCIMLPRVEGDMDETFNPENAGRLTENFKRSPEKKFWGANFLVSLPCYVAGRTEDAHRDWGKEAEDKLAGKAFEFYGS